MAALYLRGRGISNSFEASFFFDTATPATVISNARLPRAIDVPDGL